MDGREIGSPHDWYSMFEGMPADLCPLKGVPCDPQAGADRDLRLNPHLHTDRMLRGREAA
jgi:hypothetical protein